MIFTGFKRKSNQIFFNRKLPELLKNSVSFSSERIKKILIFLDDISEQDKVEKAVLSLFNIAKSDIKVVVFLQKNSKEQISEDIITPKEFGWYGKVNSEKLKSILTKKYDLLINYSRVDNLYSNLVLLQCNTGFKAGFSHLDNRFYDLTINCESNNFELFTSELKKYLIILNKI